jgi:hypothetical protein
MPAGVEHLDAIPLPVLLATMIALLLLTIESGYRLGCWRRLRQPDERDAPVGAMVGSVLGLLALVLGFTFSLSASRFDARRQAVLQEANAIERAYLQARLVEEPQSTETRRLLKQYVDLRLQAVQSTEPVEAIAASEALHRQLWRQVEGVARRDPNSAVTELFIESMNEVIEVHATRVLAGLRSRIPIPIWTALIALVLVSMAAVGYQAGLSGTRRSPAMPLLVVAFSLVLLLIADLDRGHEGLLQVSQQSLIDVQFDMGSLSQGDEDSYIRSTH